MCGLATIIYVKLRCLLDVNGSDHLYIHCVSKERLELLVQGMSCVELERCELHASFVDSLDIRRIIALCSSVINGVKVKEMFAECNSPSLKEIYSSCNFKVRLFYDLIGGQKGQLYSELVGNHTST